MEYENELYIDIDINSSNHRITVKHSKTICDAQILLDDQAVKTSLKTLAYGGAFIFNYDDTQIIITISDNDPKNISDKENYSYDCFVDGKSVQSGMPWKIGSMTYPDMTKWSKTRKAGKTAYVATETIKGVILGCALFLIMYIFAKYGPVSNFNVSWIFLLFTVLPLGLLYLILSPIDWNKCEGNYSEFQKFSETDDRKADKE